MAEPAVMPYKKVYQQSDREDRIAGFSIGNLTTLDKNFLKDDNYLSLEDLKNSDETFKHPQGKRWPNSRSNNLSDRIIRKLENSFKKGIKENDLQNLIDHFNQQCFFFGKIGTKSDHKTFKRKNGTDYFEYHHFIQQHKGRKNPELNKIIDEPDNTICLCSNCHNKIHYGQQKEVNKMLDLLWNDPQIQDMIKRYQFASLSCLEGQDPLEWITEAYT